MLSYWLLSLPAFFVTSDGRSEALDLNRRGVEAAARRDFTQAERDYRSAAAIYRSLGPAYEAHLSIALYNLAEAACGKGDWRGSEAIFAESLDLSRRAFGSKDLHTLSGLNALGHVRMMLGESDIADANFQEARQIGRESYPRDMQLAFALAGLSTLLLRQGEPEAALPDADEALRIAIDAQPGEGVETALMYQNVGQIHRAAGRPERATPMLRKARAIYERTGSDADPRYAMLLSEEGLAFMDEGRFGGAGVDMQRAIKLLEPCSGCNFELAIARNNLGLLRMRQKKYAEAGNLLREALNAEERFSPTAAEIAITKKALQQLDGAIR